MRDRKLIFEEGVPARRTRKKGNLARTEGKLLVPKFCGLYWQQNGQWRLVNVKHGLASNLFMRRSKPKDFVGGRLGHGLDRLTGVREWSAWTTAKDCRITQLGRRSGTPRTVVVSTAHGIGILDETHEAGKTCLPLRERVGRQITSDAAARDDPSGADYHGAMSR